MKLNLNLKDRLIILKSLLPQFDTRQNIRLKNSIATKIQLSTAEESLAICTNAGNNQYEIEFKSVDAISATTDVHFTDEELLYLKQRIEFVDQNGMFSADTIDTYDKIFDAPFEAEEYQNSWDKSHPNA
jgi:hypothetical protein